MDKSSVQLVHINVNLQNYISLQSTVRDQPVNETNWTLMKKLLVNELYGTMVRNLGITIHIDGIAKAYSLVLRDRGVDEETIKKANASEQILWFLKELSEVLPDAQILTLYTQLHHDVNKQNLLSYLLRDATYNIRQFPDFNSVMKEGGFSESYVTELLIEKFGDMLNEGQSAEFEKFMKQYMPIIIRYIIDQCANATQKDNSEIEIFSLNDYVNKERDLSTIKSVFVIPKPAASKKKTAEISKTKKGVVRIELASDTEVENENSHARHKAQRGDIEVDDSVQSPSIKRVKGDKIEDVKEPMLSREKGENEDLVRNREKPVPLTPVKDSESPNDINRNKDPLTTDSNEQPVVSSKRKRKHAHDDL